jgi:hypothetical protein
MTNTLDRGFRRHVLLAALLACASSSAWASGEWWRFSEVSTIDASRCEPGTRSRLEWLVARLESREYYADLWWRGWISFYGLGVGIQTVRAADEPDDGEQADLVVSAVKALGGVTRLYFTRPTARVGADPVLAQPVTDETVCLRAVEQAEGLLRKAAEESEHRWRWTPHLMNVGVNLAGALIVTQGWDEDDGWESMAVGIAVGEAMIWSHPWKGGDDLKEYESRFATAGAEPGPTWALAPYGRGLQFQLRF